MGRTAQLDNFVGSLDQLVYASFVVAYILDGNLLGLVIRCIAQLQFSSPKTHHPDRALIFHVLACLIVNSGALLYHLFMPLVKSPRGMIIDFIGSNFPPNRLHLLVLDLTTITLQALALVVTYERMHYGNNADFDDASSSEDISEEAEQLSEEEDDADYIFSAREREAPIVNLRLRHTMHRILNDKPVSILAGGVSQAQDGEADETAIARLRRIQARIRHRRRELGQSADSAGADRLEEESDEEREVGMPTDNQAGA